MSYELQRQYMLKLLNAYLKQPGDLKVLRVWRAAEVALPEWFKDTMAQARMEFPRRRVTAEHIDLLDRMLNREGDFITARMLNDTLTKFPRAKGSIDNQAKFEDRLAETLHFEWNAAGNAFHDLAWAARVLPLKRRDPNPKPLLARCKLCWRTAPSSPYGSFYCLKHLPRSSNTAYKEALRLSTWKSPTQDPDSAAYYVHIRRREVRRIAPSGFESADHDENTAELLDRLYLGQHVSIEEFIDQPRKLSWYWPRLPYSEQFLNQCKKRPNLADAASVLAALDPLGHRHRDLHQHLHAVMLRDQRQLIEMLLWTEAWLSAAAMRRQCHGGRRTRNAKS